MTYPNDLSNQVWYNSELDKEIIETVHRCPIYSVNTFFRYIIMDSLRYQIFKNNFLLFDSIIKYIYENDENFNIPFPSDNKSHYNLKSLEEATLEFLKQHQVTVIDFNNNPSLLTLFKLQVLK